MKLSKDGWGGLAVLAASLFLFALTLDLKHSPLVPIGPGFYPRLVLGLTAVVSDAVVPAGCSSVVNVAVFETLVGSALDGTV